MSRIQIDVVTHDIDKIQIFLKHEPDLCPCCQSKIKAIRLHGFISGHWNAEPRMARILYRCPSLDCLNVFIAEYQNNVYNEYEIKQYYGGKVKFSNFDNVIKELSPQFIKIYDEALIAEEHNLEEISGVGFRKAFEFLIKDYAKKKTNEDPILFDKIIKMTLANVIQKYIDLPQLQKVATMAAWLGNDETHYYRKFEGKTLEDIKSTIQLTIHWIETEYWTSKIISDVDSLKQ